MKRNESLRKLSRENTALRRALREKKSQSLRRTLELLLNQNADREQLQALLEGDCAFPHPYFCLILLFNTPVVSSESGQMVMDRDSANWALTWDEAGGVLRSTESDTWGPHWEEPLRRIIEDRVRACLSRGREADFYFLRADRDLCCLMNYPAPGAVDTIITGMNDAAEQLRTRCGLRISAAVSQEKREDFDLRECYEECLMIHDYSWNLTVSVMTYDQLEMPIYCPPEYLPAVSNVTQSIIMLEGRFLNYVTMRAFPQASHTLDALNEYLIERQRIQFARLVALTSHRLQSVLSSCYQELEAAEVGRITDTLTLIENVRSVPDLKVKTGEFFRQLDEALQPRQQNDQDRARAVISFIEANYQDPNLGAAMICEHLRMSATYLSRIMKQETGQGLVSTVHQIRLREAQHLLRDTDLSLDQIALHVGFTNRWILIRSFKNHLGMTPSDFRQNACQAE